MASSSTNLWVLLGLGFAGVLMMARRFRKVVKADFGAFLERFELLPPPQPAPPKAPHPLTDLTFAVADVFNINGYVTGFGHPDWAKTHDVASQTAAVVSTLIDCGATCVGKTVIDEMGYSISGETRHFDPPTNPAAPDRIAGGCCSGSAVSVASSLVDFSLGIDTTGGIRVPASFCGILGFRPSHGAVSNMGVVPVAQSLDCVGLFAKDPNVLRRVGHVLLKLPYHDMRRPRNVIIADDCFQLSKFSSNQVIQVVIKSTEKIFGRQVINHVNLGDYLSTQVPSLKHLKEIIHSENRSPFLESLSNAMLLLHRQEFRVNHETWLKTVNPSIDPLISTQIRSAESFGDCLQQCQIVRNEARLAVNALLKDDGVLVIPTVPNIAPKIRSKETRSDDYQACLYNLLAISGMSGCCQVTIPLGFHDKCPISVSFLSRSGGDRFLLDTVQSFYSTLQEQIHVLAKSGTSSSNTSKEDTAEMAKQKGNVAYKEKQWQRAISCYSEAIKLVGSNATYYSNRAAAYLELGSYIQADADCTTAISLDKKNVKAYLRRGTAREMMGYYHEAIDDFKHALVLEPTNKTASNALARLNKLFQ